jgi:signal transduction histidine kinase
LAVPPQRLPAPVETSAYFVVAEALTNAAKHARCSHVQVGVRVEEDALTVEVRDDGIGGATPSAGSGLRGVADRVSALGGTLELESPPGEGTTVGARLTFAAPQTDRHATRPDPGRSRSRGVVVRALTRAVVTSVMGR